MDAVNFYWHAIKPTNSTQNPQGLIYALPNTKMSFYSMTVKGDYKSYFFLKK